MSNKVPKAIFFMETSVNSLLNIKYSSLMPLVIKKNSHLKPVRSVTRKIDQYSAIINSLRTVVNDKKEQQIK